MWSPSTVKSNGGWREKVERNVKDWWKTPEERAMQPANPVNPQRVTWELSPRLPEGAIVTSDSGSCANWYARDLKMRRGMMASLSGDLAHPRPSHERACGNAAADRCGGGLSAGPRSAKLN